VIDHKNNLDIQFFLTALLNFEICVMYKIKQDLLYQAFPIIGCMVCYFTSTCCSYNITCAKISI